MPKIGRTLSYINTERKGKSTEQSPVSQSLGSSRPGGSISMSQGDYLLKSIWDKVFEIRTDSQGTEYIFGKLPVVTQYGVTMYANGGKLNIPSIYDGLPIDWNTLIRDEDGVLKVNPNIKLGGASSWDELEGKPDLSVYAKSSDVTAISSKLNDFLEGSDTDNIINKWKELESFLSGLSESDNLATILLTKADKTYVDDTFVTLATSQTITGEKNFTGGLKVNGSPIYYDTSKKYWKLEGDLLVTGGVTMYGNDSSFNPSTIMDAIAVDGTTISKSGGVLKVIGGVGASTMGSLSNVGNWADSVADVDRIMYQAAGSSSWTSKPLSSIAASGEYLPLSGGTITGDLYIGNSNNTSWMPLRFNRNGKTSFVGQGPSSVDVGFDDGHLSVGPDYFRYIKSPSQQYAVWHEGNDGSGSGLDADLLDGKHNGDLTAQYFSVGKILTSSDTINKLMSGIYCYINGNNPVGSVGDNTILLSFRDDARTDMFQIASSNNEHLLYYRSVTNIGNSYEIWSSWRTFAFTDSNVASATKLQTARTIWGQSFDGTGDVSGHITNASSFRFSGEIGIWQGNLWTSLNTDDIAYYAIRHVFWGHVGIGTISPHYKLDVNGAIHSTDSVFADYSIFANSGKNGCFLHGTGISWHDSTNSWVMDLVTYGATNDIITLHRHAYVDGLFTSYTSATRFLTNKDTDTGIWKGSVFTGGLSNVDIVYNANIHSFIGNVGIGILRPKSKLSVDTYVATDITSGNLGTPNTVGFGYVAGGCGTYFWTSPNANGHIQVGREDGNAVSYHLVLQELGGNVGIGESNPTDKLHVAGDIRLKDSSNYGRTIYFGDGQYCYLREASDDQLTIHANQGLIIADKTTINSNLLVSGGITMYSMRALKNVVDERGLSLNELSVIKPTRYTWKDGRDNRLHFGGIADDIQQVLPEVVYSTSDGILTMDYGNAAFAVASSLIKPVVDHEKRIAMLQERIVELEEEVERLKSA